MGSLNTSIVLGNYPIPVKLQRIFFERIRQGVLNTKRKLADDLRDLDFTLSQTEDQSSRVCSHCSNQVRGTRAGFSSIKASFQESEHDDDSFRFLKYRMSASPHHFASLIAST